MFVVVVVGRCSSLCASQLGPLCLALSPVALAIVFWYSLAKRVTSYTQVFLGLAMAVAPVGGWLAAGGRGGWEPWLLGLAIGTWVGGFDVLYACQDLEFDRARRPAIRFPCASACRASLAISRAMHVVTVVVPGGARRASPRSGPSISPASPASPCCSSGSSRSCSADDLSQVKRAFDMNGWVGILYLADDGRRDLLAMSRLMPDRRTHRRRRHGRERRDLRRAHDRRAARGGLPPGDRLQRLRPPAAARRARAGRESRSAARSARASATATACGAARSSSTATRISARRSRAAAIAARRW